MPKLYILDTEEVAGSNPVVPTIFFNNLRQVSRVLSTHTSMDNRFRGSKRSQESSLGGACFVGILLCVQNPAWFEFGNGEGWTDPSSGQPFPCSPSSSTTKWRRLWSPYRCTVRDSERRRQARPCERDPPLRCWRRETPCRMPLGIGTQNRFPSIEHPVLPCPEVPCQTGMWRHKTVAGLRLGRAVPVMRPAL